MAEGGDIGTMEEWIKDAEDKADPCRPFFYMGKLINAVASRAAGHHVYDPVEFVRIDIPGESKLRPDRPVEDDDKRRWPRQYATFKAGQEQITPGTPLAHWLAPNGHPRLSEAQIATFQSAGRIHVVEDIANLSDSGVGVLGPDGYKLRAEAQAFIAPRPSREAALFKENEELKQSIASLAARMAQLEQAPVPPTTPAPQPTKAAAAPAKKAA